MKQLRHQIHLEPYFANSQTAAVTPEDEYEPFFFCNTVGKSYHPRTILPVAGVSHLIRQ